MVSTRRAEHTAEQMYTRLSQTTLKTPAEKNSADVVKYTVVDITRQRPL